jgi:hypothetical protein
LGRPSGLRYNSISEAKGSSKTKQKKKLRTQISGKLNDGAEKKNK